jgi:signal transduction histidine kinase
MARDVMRIAPDQRIAAAARGFVLLALGGPILWNQDVSSVIALAALGTGWLLALSLELRTTRLRVPLVVVEATFVGLVVATELESQAVLGALAVPPFVAGLWRGLRGVLLALSAELVTVVVVGVGLQGPFSAEQSLGVFTWAAMGLALGMVATFVRGALRDDDPLAPYRHASELLRELNDLSLGLSGGLEPRSLGGLILSTVLDELPSTAVSIHVPLDDHLATLAAKSLPGGDLERCAELATTSWARDQTIVEGRAYAFPLLGNDSTVAVVSGTLPAGTSVDPAQLRLRVGELQTALEEQAVPLETGLLFEAFRDTATADERQRLSREMHDGVAQDIASLGYLVDALAAQAPTPEAEAQLGMLRERVTAIVAEVRRSVTTLRTTVGTSESLGTAIVGVTRNLSQTSGIPIEVTLDEQPQRLRPEVEAELFRITQEALNNAVKHAECRAIRVHCQVAAPYAAISVTDDGRGLGEARSDSYGMRIMRERALLIDARLSIEEPPQGGLAVHVRLPSAAEQPIPSPTTRTQEATSP